MTKFPDAVLTTQAMARADRFAMANGEAGPVLMARAGQAIVHAIVQRYAPRPTAVLCGPGNNGGDGWVAAVQLAKLGWPVRVFSMVEPDALKGDAARAAQGWAGPVDGLGACDPSTFGLVVDALFGAGLSRPLDADAARLAEACRDGQVVVSADVPSGLHGDLARADGPVFQADLTVTFHQPKPAHLLHPGRSLCGEIYVADIGIPDGWQEAATPCAVVNHPQLWPEAARPPGAGAHKHNRGRLCVLSGPAGAVGAARLTARAGLVGGAGFVTLLSSKGLIHDLSMAEPSLVVKAHDPDLPLADSLGDHRADASVLGPGAGTTPRLRDQVLSALSRRIALVLDADALSVFAGQADTLFAALHDKVVLTPHGGEFARLFPDLADDRALNKIEMARQAATRCGAVVVAKGADTVIAAPDAKVRVNIHAGAQLATMGTGDVLAGLIGALLAEGGSAFGAASAGVWIHGEAGRRCGPGATALTVLDQLPAALGHLQALRQRKAALRRVYRPDS
jgi:NAD(P)H-hydrate epimerase